MKIKNIITVVAIVAVLGLAIGVAAGGVEVAGTFWALIVAFLFVMRARGKKLDANT